MYVQTDTKQECEVRPDLPNPYGNVVNPMTDPIIREQCYINWGWRTEAYHKAIPDGYRLNAGDIQVIDNGDGTANVIFDDSKLINIADEAAAKVIADEAAYQQDLIEHQELYAIQDAYVVLCRIATDNPEQGVLKGLEFAEAMKVVVATNQPLFEKLWAAFDFIKGYLDANMGTADWYSVIKYRDVPAIVSRATEILTGWI